MYLWATEGMEISKERWAGKAVLEYYSRGREEVNKNVNSEW
jgi:hypothetical protein